MKYEFVIVGYYAKTGVHVVLGAKDLRVLAGLVIQMFTDKGEPAFQVYTKSEAKNAGIVPSVVCNGIAPKKVQRKK